MSDEELREIVYDARERIRRTTFAAPAEDDFDARTHHAEYESARH